MTQHLGEHYKPTEDSRTSRGVHKKNYHIPLLMVSISHLIESDAHVRMAVIAAAPNIDRVSRSMV